MPSTGRDDDGAAPQDGVGLVREQQVARHDLDAALGNLGEEEVADAVGALAGHAEDAGGGGAGDVRVEHADGVAEALQLDGERGGDEGLSDAALAGEHGDDVLHLGKVVLIELLGSLGGALYRVFACHIAHPFGG